MSQSKYQLINSICLSTDVSFMTREKFGSNPGGLKEEFKLNMGDQLDRAAVRSAVEKLGLSLMFISAHNKKFFPDRDNTLVIYETHDHTVGWMKLRLRTDSTPAP